MNSLFSSTFILLCAQLFYLHWVFSTADMHCIWNKNGVALCAGGVLQCLFAYLKDKDSQSLIKWELQWSAAVVSQKDFADLKACFSVMEVMDSSYVMRQWHVYCWFLATDLFPSWTSSTWVPRWTRSTFWTFWAIFSSWAWLTNFSLKYIIL